MADIPTNNLDAGTDSPAAARVDILAAVQRLNMMYLSGPLSVLGFGADRTGAADSSPAINAALADGYAVWLPHGKYRLGSAVVPRSGSMILGAGRGLDPYHDPAAASNSGTELLVVAGTGISLNGRHNVFISGAAIKSLNNGNSTSAYGAAPSYQAGTIGIDITGSQNAQITDISFHGLQYGIAASPTTNGAEAAFFRLDNWIANDCLTVVKVGNATTSAYVARDFAIRGCEIALHCGQIVDVNYSDGVRIEVSRFFQAHGDSVVIKNSPFVTACGVTVFESGGHTMTLENCPYPSISGLTASRAGGYTATTPWAAKDAIRLINCPGASVQGMVEHPGGRAALVQGCAGAALNLAIDTPYYTNGLQSVSDNTGAETLGAIAVSTSSAVNLACSVSTESVIYAVSCDAASAPEVTGSVATGGYAGMYRAPLVRGGAGSDGSIVLPADVLVGAMGSVQVGGVQVRVPAGKSVYSRCARVSVPGARVRSGAVFFLTGLTDDGDGSTSFQRGLLATNATGSTAWLSVPVQIYNPGATTVTVPAGARVLLSVGVE